jgi:hypothetical protein
MTKNSRATLLRIELWHGLLLITLLLALGPMGIVEPWALAAGGIFMGVNFFLLGCGVWWVLTPLAGKGRIKTGLFLLGLKFLLFLGLLAALFFPLRIDAISFALGFSTLLAAILVETLRSTERWTG